MKSRELIFAIIFLILFKINGSKGTCGRRISDFNPLIIEGFQANNNWPWHAAIYHVAEEATTEQEVYVCGGTLIDSDTILTAAHCVCKYNQRMSPKNIKILLGKLNLSVNETSSQSFEAIDVIQHPMFNSIDLRNDIAIIKLSATATLNNFVQPICLWDSTKVELSEVIGKLGTVIGFGRTKSYGLSNVLLQAFMPVISSWSCLDSNRPFFGSYLSDKNFCAGFRNGTSACNGDSGGSISFEENEVFYIRGIVSLIQGKKEKSGEMLILCDINEYVLFTDVAQYLPWIEEVRNQLDNECEKKVHCLSFEQHQESGDLKCKINLNITFADRYCKITFEDSSNTAVTVLTINGNVEALPDLTEAFNKFKNIAHLDVGFTRMKYVERNKLTITKQIKYVSFYGNRLNEIAADSFDDLNELEYLLLADNRLKVIHRDVFKELHNLKDIWLQKNQLEILPEGLFRNNHKLENIFASENGLKIIDTDFTNLRKLVAIDLRSNDCIDEWCDPKTFCGTSSMHEMQTKISNKC